MFMPLGSETRQNVLLVPMGGNCYSGNSKSSLDVALFLGQWYLLVLRNPLQGSAARIAAIHWLCRLDFGELEERSWNFFCETSSQEPRGQDDRKDPTAAAIS